VAQSGVPQYLGAPDDLKLLLMKAESSKTPTHGYHVSDGNRLSFQGRWYVCLGLLSRLQGREFEVYFDRRDISVLYLFMEGIYVGEAYCTQFLGGRVSEWEAKAMRKHDEMMAKQAREQGRETRARIQSEAGRARKRRSAEIRQAEHSRQWDRQREDIHPAEVLERLTSVKSLKPASAKLPPARPDADPDREVTCLTYSHGTRGALVMTHPLFRKEIFVETAFERRFQAMLRSAWHKRAFHWTWEHNPLEGNARSA